MKVCYLLQGRDDPEVALQYAIALSKEDYVVITLNDAKWRDEAYYMLVKNPNILLSTSTPFAQEGDYSAARCWLYQMKDALEKFDFDICVNLTEKTLPTQPREAWMKMLQEDEIKNALLFDHNSIDDRAYAATMDRFFFSTNSNKFSISEKTRKRARVSADIAHVFGIRRKIKDTLYEGEPWFVFDKQTAMNLSDNIGYASDNFIMSWYPERTVFHTMWKKFLNHKQIENKNFVQTTESDPMSYFTFFDKLPDRNKIAEILTQFQPLYEAPYDFVAEEIIEVDKRSIIRKLIDGLKNKNDK